MPTDLQLIDGLDRLRALYLQEHPAAPVSGSAPPGGARQQIAEAWIQAMDGRRATPGAAHRRLRRLTRTVLEPDDCEQPHDEAERALLMRAEALREGIAAAGTRGLPPLASAPATRSIHEELQEWERLLPGLKGMRSWLFMAWLGRPVVVPDAPVRRFLWRLGALDDAAGREALIRATHSTLERIAQLTGIAPPLLGRLLEWHTRAQRGGSAGGACCGQPHCERCPLRPGCAWPRFHPQPGEAAGPSPEESIAPARRHVLEDRLDPLREAELLALLLPSGPGGLDRLALAEGLLRRFNGLRGLERASAAEMARERGISRQRAIQIKAALELGRRFAAQTLTPGDPIRSSDDLWRAYRWRFRNLPQEHFMIVLLDTKNRVIQDHLVSKGTLNGSMAHPREVFQQAVRQAAASVILLHNHPSGDPTPSPEDREVTQRLRKAGEILGIRVLDHIILGADDYHSFKDEGE